MNEEAKQMYITRMVENLPVLRAKSKLTQKELADIIGVTNYSISGMEKGTRRMTWNTFMSLLPIFSAGDETLELMRLFGIYTPELEEFLHRSRARIPLSDETLDGVAAAGEANTLPKGK